MLLLHAPNLLPQGFVDVIRNKRDVSDAEVLPVALIIAEKEELLAAVPL